MRLLIVESLTKWKTSTGGPSHAQKAWGDERCRELWNLKNGLPKVLNDTSRNGEAEGLHQEIFTFQRDFLQSSSHYGNRIGTSRRSRSRPSPRAVQPFTPKSDDSGSRMEYVR
jgi:hypothetical protein